MGFQTEVNSAAAAVLGDRYSLNPQVTLIRTAKEAVKFGSFVWLTDDGFFTGGGEGSPLGIALRTGAHFFASSDESCEEIPESAAVSCLVRGDVYTSLGSGASRWQKVFVNSSGETCAANAGDAVDGFAETAFYVLNPCEAGQTVAVSTDIHP